MNLKKKFVIGAASVALVAGMGGVAAPAAVAVDGTLTLPGYAKSLTRLAGLDRVQTSLAVADKQFGKGMHNSVNRPTRLYIASAADGNMVDAASAGMLQDGPIVFVYGSSYVSTAVGEHVKNFEKNTGYNGYANISEVVAIGGDGAVSDAALKNVAGALKVSKTSRLGGKDRYETSVAIADYIYGQAQKAVKGDGYRDRNGGLIINAATTNLNVVYIANGADTHVVDSMVSGTLDNGPVLLATPDGKIPEPVAEFIKKTLPEQFAALGGAPTVPDSTIQEAWLIKALANKWDTSYSVPDLKKKVDDLQRIVNGNGDSAKYSALDFKGMERSYQDSVNIYNAWHGEYTKNTNAVNSKYFAQDNHSKVALTDAAAALLDPTTAPGQAFLALYGTNEWVQKDIEGYFDTWTEDGVKYARSFDFDRFTKDKLGSDFIDPATDALNKVWTGIQADFSALQTNNAGAAFVAMASQDFPDLAIPTSGTRSVNLKVPMAAVNFVADYARSAVETLLKNKKAELASTSQSLRNELDKIAPKTELRLGGADRFETAQLIANQFAKTYGRVMTNGGAVDFNEAYIASGYRMADSLAAGQLAMGPILLVKGTEKDGKELPEFTQNVAKNLMCWTRQATIDVYGIGGEGVLADSALEATIALIDNPNCKVAAPTPGASKKLTAVVTKPAIKTGTAQNGEVEFYWDGVKITAGLAEDVNTAGAEETHQVHDGNDKVKATDVTTTTNNADENLNSFDGDLSVANGVLTLTVTNLTPATGKVGHVVVPVTFKGETVMVDIPVYNAATTATLGTTASPKATVAQLALTADKSALPFAQPATTGDAVKACTVDKSTLNIAKAAGSKAPDSGYAVTIEKGAAGNPDNVVFSWPKGEYKTNDELSVDIVCQTPGNAPTTVKVADKLA